MAAGGQKPLYEPEKHSLEDHPVEAYALALCALDAAGVPHLVGGGLALSRYGRRRPTKDLDIFIHPRDAERAMHALAAAGFTALDTDKVWLHKAQGDGVHIDLILHSSGPLTLSEAEVARGVVLPIAGVPMRVFAPEDLLLRKIYAMREDGADWLDAFSIIEGEAQLDWTRLDREGLDPRQLAGFLLVAAVRAPTAVPPHVIERHLARAQAALQSRALRSGPTG